MPNPPEPRKSSLRAKAGVSLQGQSKVHDVEKTVETRRVTRTRTREGTSRWRLRVGLSLVAAGLFGGGAWALTRESAAKATDPTNSPAPEPRRSRPSEPDKPATTKEAQGSGDIESAVVKAPATPAESPARPAEKAAPAQDSTNHESAVNARMAALVDSWRGHLLPALITWNGGETMRGLREDWEIVSRDAARVSIRVFSDRKPPRPAALEIVGDSLTAAALSDLCEPYELPEHAGGNAVSLQPLASAGDIMWAGVDHEADVFVAKAGSQRVLLVAPRSRTVWVSRHLLDYASGNGYGAASPWMRAFGGLLSFDLVLGARVTIPVAELARQQDWELRGSFCATAEDASGASGLEITVQVDPTREAQQDPAHDLDPLLRRKVDSSGAVAFGSLRIPRGSKVITLSAPGYHWMWSNLRLVAVASK
jgi:hypothetical protein